MKNVIKKIHNSKIMKLIRKPIVNSFWALCLILGITSITGLFPYAIVVGIMLILISILTLPWFNKIACKFNIELTLKQKWFIGITNFLTATYSIKLTTKEYYRCFISSAIMILFWVITIYYSNKKRKKD